MVVGLAVVIPANALAGGGVGTAGANGQTIIAARDKMVKPGRKDKGRPAQGKTERHLRAVRPGEVADTETVVLERVIAALDKAIESPALSTGWHAALISARTHLAQAVAESPRE